MVKYTGGLTGEAPIIFTRYTDEFEKPDWSVTDKGAFELSNIIQTIQLEASTKGKYVMIQVALVDPGDVSYEEQNDGQEEDQKDEQQ